ncbi:glycoside hydrolase family 3 N-terminal domain-containing protein [Agromyces allii]|uniref:Glycoside hydrolase family 3 C-terminal domain-containing protein n=1 Tax=Agromyces allii TaxID=393607 RepID=A0ABN2R5C5_9MICO|nr:glycoside hydrolase family 3 N-terminal domain-containing protein [Agromyces allii]
MGTTAPHTASPTESSATIDDLIAQLSLDEKVLLLEGVDSWNTNGIERLGIPRLYVTDGPHGLRKVRDAAGAFGLADNEPTTAFPTSVTVANTWNPELARRMGQAIARESVDHDVHVLLAPGVNIKRNPLCGRNFEYSSEDPLVSGAFGSAFVQGVQGEGVAASVKHFAANQNENFRFVGDSLVDERAFREIYLRAFERIVNEAKPATVMCAYNAINGTFCSDNRMLLTGILREEWGFDGVVMTDWGATHDRIASLNAGCELDMPGEVRYNREQLLAGVRDGRIAPETLDEAVRRMLRLVERTTGAARVAGAAAGNRSAPLSDPAAHADLAREIATEGAVLLANDGTLPMNAAAVAGSLAVVGEMFEKMRFQGAGSSLISPPEVIAPKDAFDRRGIEYAYARGYRSLSKTADAALEHEAVALARSAGTVLFFGGLDDLEESEGFDREHMRLGEHQTALLRQVLDTGARVVLVLFAGAPVELPFVDELAAVLNLSLPGMYGGEATAALLFGEANPSGKLAETWTRTHAESSSCADFDRERISQYAESIYVGYRFHDRAGTAVRFPFGHGLSYTSFAYRDLDVRVSDDRVEAAATIANTGERDGAEVVQLYVRNNDGAVFKAEKELRAFTKVRLAAGESTRIALSFDLADLAYWDVAQHGWVLENGTYEVVLAASAAEARLAAPLVVTTGQDSRSPYSAAVDADYAMPPATIPASFPELLGSPVPTPDRSRRLSLETRLVDAKRSVMGAIMHAVVVGAVSRGYRSAMAMPESLERDARLKSSHFVMRMMPFMSLRSMTMSSSGGLSHEVAAGIVDIAAWHPVRGLRRMLKRSPTTAARTTERIES